MLQPKPISTWHVVIGGFLQDAGRPNGMVRLWRRLNALSSPETRVDFFNWNASWDTVAELIWHLQHDGAPQPIICVYGYSWGAGHGAIQLARQLRKRGLFVNVMVLSDPVYRSSLLIGRWLAMTIFGRIRIPDNVGKVIWFRQTMNRPAGHDLIAEDAEITAIAPPKTLRRTHQYMDDAPEFHAECERIATL